MELLSDPTFVDLMLILGLACFLPFVFAKKGK